jgi:hypothetical protein
MKGDNDVRKVVEFLQRSELVNLDVPVSQVVKQAGELEVAGGGHVLIWSQWILITAPCGPPSAIIAMGSGANPAEATKYGAVEMGERS